MKKNITIILFLFITLILFGNIQNDNKIANKEKIYALTLDGEKIDTFPSKGLYRVDVICENANGKWLYNEWKLSIENVVNDNVTCDVNFASISKTNLNNYIINLNGSEQGTGQVVKENGYRYEGKNPNNYILFNNELWRIIGVFDDSSHGKTNENLVKIIREETIGGLAWNNMKSSDTNNWEESNLKTVLNEAYYNAVNGTNGGYCYGYSYAIGDAIVSNCNFINIGINDMYRPMIEQTVWYLGGFSSNEETAESFYNYERTITSDFDKSLGYIGLIYPSDYGYSVLSSNCERTTSLSNYSNENCAGQSWMFVQGYEWTITGNSTNSAGVFHIGNNGKIVGSAAYNGYSVRPTLYLKSDVYVLDGDGSISDPYIIGM